MPGGLLDQADSGALERAASRFLGRARQTAVRALAAVVLKDGTVQTPELRFLNFRGAGVAVSYDRGNRAANVDILGAPVDSSTTTVVSAAGQGKFFALGSEPSGWHLAGFNDASWTTSIAQILANIPGAPVSGTVWICLATGTQPASQEWLFRVEFALPAGSVTSGTLEVGADNWLMGSWLNGTAVYAPGAAGASLYPPASVSVPVSAFLPGQTNCLALRIKNDAFAGLNTMDLDFKLTVTLSVGGTDPQYAQNSSLALYQLRSEKDANSGYAGLDSGGKVATAELGTGSASGSTYLRGDRAWATLPSGFSDPMTTAYDVIYRNGSNVTDRLGKGADGTFLGVSGGALGYYTPSGGAAFSGCRVTNSADFSIVNSTVTTLTWNTESYDTDNYHSTSSNTSRMTVPTGKGGYFLVTAGGEWNSSNTTGRRGVGILVNGTGGYVASQWVGAPPDSSGPRLSCATVVHLNDGDYLESQVFQNSGGSLTLFAATSPSAHLSLTRLG